MSKETETLVEEKRKRRKIPEELIYEIVKGRPIYYSDYDKVLTGRKTLEVVMGSSGLQSYSLCLF